MPRAKKCRRIGCQPGALFFKPKGIPLCSLEISPLSLDEFEAIRLADLEGLDQAEAALRMNVSRATFGRILERAHRAIAQALVNGQAIAIEPLENTPHCIQEGEQP